MIDCDGYHAPLDTVCVGDRGAQQGQTVPTTGERDGDRLSARGVKPSVNLFDHRSKGPVEGRALQDRV